MSLSTSPSGPVYHHLREDEPAESSAAVSEESSSGSSRDNNSNDNIGGTISLYQKRQRNRAVVLLSLCTVLLFADQNLMAPNLTAIATYFGFDDEQRDRKLGGDIALAFYVLGAPASFLIGCLADSYDRTKLFAITIFLGEGSCLATFFAQTYPQLYVCRAITGVSVGGAVPLIYSVLGDLYAAEERHAVSSYVGIGVGVGISFGQGVAGFLGPTFGWRLPFLVISAPALICAALFLFLVDDPERGGMEEAVRTHHRQQIEESRCLTDEDPMGKLPVSPSGIEMSPLRTNNFPADLEKASSAPDGGTKDAPPAALPAEDPVARAPCSTFLSLLATPTLLLALLQGAPGCVPWGIVNTYLNDFLHVDRGMTVEFATFTVLLFGLGNFFGMLFGGHGGAYLYLQDKRYPALFAGFTAILGCFPFWILLNHVNAGTSLWTIGAVSTLAGIATGVTGPIIKATLQNVTLPQARGQAFALFTLFDDFGRGLGPVFVAILIVRMGGRTPAFNVGVIGWILCGVANLLVFFTVRRDERLIQEQIIEMLSTPSTSTPSHANEEDVSPSHSIPNNEERQHPLEMPSLSVVRKQSGS